MSYLIKMLPKPKIRNQVYSSNNNCIRATSALLSSIYCAKTKNKKIKI